MTKQKRWKCPHCNSGVLAPSRPRKNDVRRYCLTCSKKHGVLIERTAPTLEAKRIAQKAKSVVRVKAKAESKRAKYMIAGIDAEKYMRKLAVLPVYGGRKGRPYQMLKRKSLSLTVHRSKYGYRTKLGHCSPGYWSADIHLHTDPHWTEFTLRQVLLHELMHIVCERQNGRWHTREFHRKMKVAWRQAERKLGKPAHEGSIVQRGRWTERQGITLPTAANPA